MSTLASLTLWDTDGGVGELSPFGESIKRVLICPLRPFSFFLFLFFVFVVSWCLLSCIYSPHNPHSHSTPPLHHSTQHSHTTLLTHPPPMTSSYRVSHVLLRFFCVHDWARYRIEFLVSPPTPCEHELIGQNETTHCLCPPQMGTTSLSMSFSSIASIAARQWTHSSLTRNCTIYIPCRSTTSSALM